YANGLSAPGTTSCSFGSPQFPCTVTSPAWPNDEIWTQTNPGTEEDKSIFGELYYKFLDKWTLTLGGRQYWLSQTADYTADGFLNGGPTPSSPQSNSQSGFNPKVALQLQATEATMVYASASKGFRAGGAQANFPGCSSNIPVEDVTHIKSDTLWTYELGTKVQTSSVLLSAAAYDIEWSDLQQQAALPCGFYLQVNGNKARIRGGEIEANGRLTQELQFRAGIGIAKSDITDPGNLALVGQNGNPGIQPGTRISGVPDFTAFVGAVYTHSLSADTEGFVTADYSYTGNSTSLLVGGAGNVATRPGYGLVNLRFGVDRGQNELSLNFRNVFNVKPNLGDIGYIGYAQFSQAGSLIPQVATLQPLTVSLQYTKFIR
ncbi:MAG TPA: TonB-dependent receptor, partial [Steroidobacteraceae bacterium]|nr:TonB-dependent receptor [Steroidobacteraceae bacterium]